MIWGWNKRISGDLGILLHWSLGFPLFFFGSSLVKRFFFFKKKLGLHFYCAQPFVGTRPAASRRDAPDRKGDFNNSYHERQE